MMKLESGKLVDASVDVGVVECELYATQATH